MLDLKTSSRMTQPRTGRCRETGASCSNFKQRLEEDCRGRSPKSLKRSRVCVTSWVVALASSNTRTRLRLHSTLGLQRNLVARGIQVNHHEPLHHRLHHYDMVYLPLNSTAVHHRSTRPGYQAYVVLRRQILFSTPLFEGEAEIAGRFTRPQSSPASLPTCFLCCSLGSPKSGTLLDHCTMRYTRFFRLCGLRPSSKMSPRWAP
ncbi:hypothetical protein N657DRAFT_121036 [Parathielavia appendiculata]|uniref:Uncharacterized protein n=1 Tax=Parathielavia appendiculata TaxID=2587402 RepID=A0AAN6TVE3_9PEZI|nr:hypothetical protein N657DRAFT_121036 [Parathielavia appendiculata]